MANTYTQLHHQVVFATQYRAAAIHSLWKEQLHKYITAIVQDHNHKMVQINTMPDHVHMLIGLRPIQSISSLIQIVKSESTKCPPDRLGRDSAAKILLLPICLAGGLWGF